MKPGAGYVPVESQAPLRGLATALSPLRILEDFSPFLLNCIAREGEIRSRPGYTLMGTNSSPLIGTAVLGIVQFGPLGGTIRTVILTSKRQYYYDDLTDAFFDITAQYVGAVADTTTITATTIPVVGNYTEHFLVNDVIKLTGSTENDGFYTVASSSWSTPNTTITINETFPGTTADATINFDYNMWDIKAADSTSDWFEVQGDHTGYWTAGRLLRVSSAGGNTGEYVVSSSATDGVAPDINTQISVTTSVTTTNTDVGNLQSIDEFVTGAEQFMDWAEATDINERQLIVTNGASIPRTWSGDITEKFHHWRPDFTSLTTCRTISVFSEYLFLGAVTLSTSGEDPQSVAWSDSGDFRDFNTGSSGVQLLHELETPIKEMRTLGDRLVIYSNDQIVNGSFVGGAAVFAFETVIPEGTRLISTNAVGPINVGHV